MENTGIIDEKDSRLYDLNESSLSSIGNKISRTFIYGKSLTAPILGSFVPVPDVPKMYVEPTVLDTSLSHTIVYTRSLDAIDDDTDNSAPVGHPSLKEKRLYFSWGVKVSEKCIKQLNIVVKIPTYTHLKMYDLKSVERPKTPPVLLALRSKFFYRNGTESRLSSKTSLLTEQMSERMNSVMTNWREGEKVLKTE